MLPSASLTLLLAMLSAPAGQAVPNGGFERVDAQGRVVGWSLEPCASANAAERSELHASRGRAALHLKCGPNGRPYCDAVSPRVAVEPEQRYVLTFRVHGGGNVFTHFYDAAGKPLPPTRYYGFGGRRWSLARVEFAAPKRAAKLALRFRVYPPKGEAWIDEVAIEKATPRRPRLRVPNPGFEIVDAAGASVGWAMEAGSPRNAAEAAAGQAARGRRALHLRAADPKRPYCDAISTLFPVRDSTTYTLSFDVKAPRGGRVFTHVYAEDGRSVGLRGADAGMGFSFGKGSNKWKRVVVRFTPAAGARHIRLRFRVYPPKGEAWIDNVQIDEGPATPFDPGPRFQLTLALPRGAFARGETLAPDIVCFNQGARAAGRVRATVEYSGRTLLVVEKSVDLPESEPVTLKLSFPTTLLRCGRYRVRAALLANDENAAVAERTFHLAPALKPTLRYGFYGYRIEGCPGRRFEPPGFTPANIDRGFDLLASAHMNAFASPVRYPRDTFLYFLDAALRRGVEVMPLVGGYFGARADSDADYALDAKGQKIFVHTKKDRPNLSLISPAARRAAAHAMRYALRQFDRHPAFAGHIYFGDDVAMWRGKPDIYRGPIQDYSPFALRAFKAKTGLDAPRRTAEELRRVHGVLPDDDPWLTWMKFRCQDIFAGYMAAVIAAKNEVAPFAKAGSEHGAVWRPGVGAVPSYEHKVLDLLTYYAYPAFPPYHILFCEMAFLGGRNKELWATPSAYNSIWGPQFEERTPAYERSSFFSILAGGAKAVTCCPFQTQAQWIDGHPAVWAEFRRLGELAHRYGPFLYRLRPARGRIGLLLSFSTSAYRAYDMMPDISYENTHTHAVAGAFFALLRAQLPVEIVDEEQLRAGEAKRYKAILLADVQVLPKSVYDALTSYVRAGGKVLLDERCRIAIPGAVRLKTRFDAHPDDKNLSPRDVQAAAARARRAFEGIVEPILQCDSYDLAVREFRAGDTTCLMLLNLKVEEPLTARVELPSCAAACDVFEGRRIERRATLRIRPGGGKVVLLSPQAIASVKLDAPNRAVQGEPFALRFRVLDAAGRPVRGLQPVELRIVDPAGAARDEYAGYLAAENGQLALSPRFALNDPPGRWIVVARELLTGREAVAGFTLVPALEVSVEPAGQTADAKGMRQRFELNLKNNLPRRLSVRIAPRWPKGLDVSVSGGERSLDLSPGGSRRLAVSCSTNDDFYAGPLAGRIELRLDGPYAVVEPVFFVFWPAAKP